MKYKGHIPKVPRSTSVCPLVVADRQYKEMYRMRRLITKKIKYLPDLVVNSGGDAGILAVLLSLSPDTQEMLPYLKKRKP